MPDSIESIRKAVFDLLSLPSRRLLAIGFGGLIAVLGLTIAAHLDPTTFGAGAQTISGALLAISILAVVLGGFQVHAERHTRTFEFTGIGHECWAGVTTQRDGRITTQIVCDLRVFNLTDDTRWLTDIRLVYPKTRARVLNHMIMVRQQVGQYYGGYPIPPRARTDARVHMIVEADLSRGIDRRGITLRIADQDKHWHTLRFPDAAVEGRVVVPPNAVPMSDAEGVSVEPPNL
jgi:hypothetical protein